MKVVPMGEVRNYFSKYLANCADEPVFVTKNGRITAVLESMDDSQIEDFLLERAPRFRAMLRKAGREKGGMSLKAFRASRKI